MFIAKPSDRRSKNLSVVVHAADCSCVADGRSQWKLEATTLEGALAEVAANERDEALPDPTRGVKISAAPCAAFVEAPLTAEEMLQLARYALTCAERTLEGGYPWLLNKPKFTQREAREACLGVVVSTLNRIGHNPQSNYISRPTHG